MRPLPPDAPPPARSRLWIWLAWLAAFYATWLVIVFAGDRLDAVLGHWPIAVAMAFGSYVAGSTPMGGGTVGFPILVLFFSEPATLGRDFSFCVQSIGMTSASIYLIARRRPIEWPMLWWAMAGSLVGTPLGIHFVAPRVPDVAIKVIFAVVWASFGVLHLWRMRELAGHESRAPGAHRFDRMAGLLVGFFSGLTVAAITGVGIDMVLYAVLVLLCQADLRIAIPTSVVIMAFTSVVGVATKFLTTGFKPGVFENWLAAAPIVALGAPLGAIIVNRVGRVPTLYFVSVLCLVQFVWTMRDEWARLGYGGLAVSIVGVLAFNLFFERLRRLGNSIDRRKRGRAVATGEFTARA